MMRVLTRYLIREFIKLLILCQAIFVSIYFVMDFLDKIDNFIEAHARASVILAYFFYKIPLMSVQMLPAATLISVIILFSLMRKRNEIAAIKACGINLFRISASMITASLFVGVAAFFVSEIVVPYGSSKSNEIWNIDVEKRGPGSFYGHNEIWYKGKEAIYFIEHFDNKNMIMNYPTFYFFDKNFQLVKRIDAQRGIWTGDQWKIEKGIILETSNGGDYEAKRFEDIYLDLPESPQTFMRVEKEPEEMNYWQLKRYSERVRSEGYDNTTYLVDMNLKIVFPFITLILMVIGIPVALREGRGGSPTAVALGIVICFLYLTTLAIARSLGLSGMLPPLLSAWMPNGIFLLFGVYLMMHMNR